MLLLCSTDAQNVSAFHVLGERARKRRAGELVDATAPVVIVYMTELFSSPRHADVPSDGRGLAGWQLSLPPFSGRGRGFFAWASAAGAAVLAFLLDVFVAAGGSSGSGE